MKWTIALLLLINVFRSDGQDTFLNYEEVWQKAHQENKSVMMVFAGSDWCKPCIQLKNEILTTELFKKEAEHFIYLYLDFPYKKKNRLSKEETSRNEQFAEQYNQSGQFPYVVLADQEGKTLGVVSYVANMKPEDFIGRLHKISAHE